MCNKCTGALRLFVEGVMQSAVAVNLTMQGIPTPCRTKELAMHCG